jgi:uncharacterized protein
MNNDDRGNNVLGTPLEDCSQEPRTGFFRDGCCRTGPMDRGVHSVCSVMTAEFLSYSQAAGNDLSTPRPEYGFPGLSTGDRWCLCALRWQQAYEAGKAPKVVLAATAEETLTLVSLDALMKHGADLQWS